ncbi:hypothetical protein EDEG_03483 [Edhazardia aedis USNM 41457]|uniref:DNA topoisomerase 2 n=1 Tax=Edhazardia aedis (strain USNM 41457) TaxID=1003232 RepID=J9D3E4_EDHAE|nr:hypothetical protein EDEG_03483 [Edhazardia aedis USNM 41457]|eukprot:EJW02059.1 hypothetical protein EDEG_03483 [Edhazardia aedis USNM 41457]
MAVKTIEEQYQKKSQIEHILLRPDTYIGSIEHETQSLYILDGARIAQKSINYVPGLFKIFDEVLVNAADNKIRDSNMSYVKVIIDSASCVISVENDGKGIPVAVHKTEKVYVPELIFGHLLTSSNYNDKEKKMTGGRNGYGAKLCNIFSSVFVVETRDKHLFYRQTFYDNMGRKDEPEIVDLRGKSDDEVCDITRCVFFKENKREKNKDVDSNGNGSSFNYVRESAKRAKKGAITSDFTRITFKPDLKKFNMSSLDADIIALLSKRVYDLSGTVKDISVFLNNREIKSKGFKSYCKLYFENADEHVFYHSVVNDRWEIVFSNSEDQFSQVSFVNSICTSKGGTHVNHVLDQIIEPIAEHIKKKEKGLTIKPFQIKSSIFIFINCLIENPSFDSQTKENLTLNPKKFGSKCVPIDDIIKQILRNGSFIEKIVGFARAKQSAQLKKTDGTKTTRLSGIPKLDDANMAGTRQSSKCTLILTEGDSAKALAVSGLSVVGRDFYGVFPLRGKLLNVREASHKQIMENSEINAIKKIVGLQHGKAYDDVASLRYGHIMIMTDQDHDGSHIKGLLINFLDHFFPSLLRIKSFLQVFITPIVRVSKKNAQGTIDFFTLPEFYKWQAETPGSEQYKIKYYKGLGTSTSADAKFYFSNLPKHVKNFDELTASDKELLNLAFNKKKADQRKSWLKNWAPGVFLDNSVPQISISDFVNKELILFSMADNIRSIPCLVDGFKPGQRKVLFSCFKRKLTQEVKVAQLAGYVSEHSAYHHGEASLCGTIINLAQNFVGSNNINLLSPNGQFGTRLQGGKDAASPRYLYTNLEKITRLIFRPEDDNILNYLSEDNITVEPEFYVPIIPMVLVNGPEGIGTGWSTTIPNYNVVDIIANIRKLMNNETQTNLVPFYKGFTGSITALPNERSSRRNNSNSSVDNDPINDSSTLNAINNNESTGFSMSNNTESNNNLGLGLLNNNETLNNINTDSITARYKVTGLYTINSDEVEIKELPVGMWTQTYKEFLETLVTDNTIKDFKEYHTENTVYFKLLGTTNITHNNIEKKLKLSTTISLNNLVCFDSKGFIKKYSSPSEIINEFYHIRLQFYSKRKEYLLKCLYEDLKKLENKVRFIKEIIEETLIIRKRKKCDIEQDLENRKYDMFEKSYDYLLNMPLLSLTLEKIQKLNQEKEEKNLQYNILRKKTNKDLWNDDLNEFEQFFLKENEAHTKMRKDEIKKEIRIN